MNVAALAPYRGVRVLVLGGDGFIGRWAARLLTAAGAEVHVSVLDRAAAEPVLAAWEVQAAVQVANLTDPAVLGMLLGAVEPALVVNAVGYGVAPAEKRAENLALAEAINRDLPRRLGPTLSRIPSTPREGHVRLAPGECCWAHRGPAAVADLGGWARPQRSAWTMATSVPVAGWSPGPTTPQ